MWMNCKRFIWIKITEKRRKAHSRINACGNRYLRNYPPGGRGQPPLWWNCGQVWSVKQEPPTTCDGENVSLSFMASLLTLRMRARMKQYAIRPISFLFASGHWKKLREKIKVQLPLMPALGKVESPIANVKCQDQNFHSA